MFAWFWLYWRLEPTRFICCPKNIIDKLAKIVAESREDLNVELPSRTVVRFPKTHLHKKSATISVSKEVFSTLQSTVRLKKSLRHAITVKSSVNKKKGSSVDWVMDNQISAASNKTAFLTSTLTWGWKSANLANK